MRQRRRSQAHRSSPFASNQHEGEPRCHTDSSRDEANRGPGRDDALKAFVRLLRQTSEDERLEGLGELTARIEIAAARHGSAGPSLALAERGARRLTKTRAKWAIGLGTLLDAQIAHQRGDALRARSLLGDAVRRLDSCALYLHAATARHALGRLDSDEGLAREADEWFHKKA